MNGLPDKYIIDAIRRLYGADELAAKFFDFCAARERDASSTSIELLMRRLSCSRADAVKLAKELHETGCGKFVVGRRSSKSRMEWLYGLRVLGQVAAGEALALEKPSNEAFDEDELEIVDEQSAITIPQLKEMLARHLGISPANIEVNIKA